MQQDMVLLSYTSFHALNQQNLEKHESTQVLENSNLQLTKKISLVVQQIAIKTNNGFHVSHSCYYFDIGHLSKEILTVE